MQGIQQLRPESGNIYIVKYRDGSVAKVKF